MSDLVVARTSGVVMVNGRRHSLRKGVTVARVGHPLVAEKPRLWEPLTVHYDVSQDGAVDETPVQEGGDVTDEATNDENQADDEPDADDAADDDETRTAAEPPVEQATAAPGEKRNVRPARKAAKKAQPGADDGN